VIYKEDRETGKTLEPIEEVHIEIADAASGTVFELMGARRGDLVHMHSENGTTYLKYLIPTRLLIGFQSQFMRATSGMGQLHSLHYGYDVVSGESPTRQFGSLIADQDGTAMAYALVNLQQRGTFFIEPQTEVYEGMVVGEHIRQEDLSVNVAKAKHLTNFRAKPSETTAGLTPARRMSLDDCIEFLAEDELLEVTPESLRLRKRVLNNEQRLKANKAAKKLQGVV
jgi:GTP-binding protein